MNDILILAIIWASVFAAAFLAHKTRLTPVIWFLILGAVMVNSGVLPKQMPLFITNFSELAIIIIMFALGFEENTSNFVKGIKRSWGIALFGAVVPFAVAYFATLNFWGSHNIALLCALAMTATAVSLTMVSLKTERLHKTEAATGIMTSAILDDIGSLALVAILVPIATGESNAGVLGILLVLGKAFSFFIILIVIGRWIFPKSNGWLRLIPVIGHIHLRGFLSMGKGEYTVLALVLIAVLVGLMAHEFGFHPAIGAYMAGLIIHKDYFDFHHDKKVDFYKRARGIIDNVAFTWIGPIFFVTMGTKLIFDSGVFLSIIPEAVILFLLIFVGQVTSAGLAAKYMGKFDNASSLLIGFGMLGRAELAFVVLNIAFVQYQLITSEAFFTLMLTTTLLNFSVPISIRWWKLKYQSSI